MKDLHAIVVRHIKHLLRERQMNDAAFAKKIKKSTSTVSNWFAGRRKIKLSDLVIIAEGLGVSEVELIAGPGTSPPIGDAVTRERALEVIGAEFGYDVVLKKRRI